jgi:murein DD-endopeptidase
MLPDSLRYPPGGKPWLLYALLGASLLVNLGLAVRFTGGAAPVDAPEPAAAPSEVQPVGADTDISNAPVPPELVPPLPEPKGVAQQAGTEVFTGTVTSSLSATFQQSSAQNPAALSAVYARLFAWDLDLRRDLHKNDVVEVLYEQPAGQEPVILAARFRSQPGTAQEKVYAAFRYQAPGDRFPSYWSATGEEVPRRLIDGPVQDYEQITSLLKDRPTHEGMDFKTPIGTPITAPRAGKVTRVNWNHAANGNCVEVQFTDGALAKFLHLNENAVKEGQSVSAGTEIGKAGNTGHSTGPHLHYQLEKGGKVVDPIAYHGTLRRQMQPDGLPGFQQELEALTAQLDGRVATR